RILLWGSARSKFCLNEFFCSKIGFVGASARSACRASVRLGGEESCCGGSARSKFCLNEFFVLRLALLWQACAFMGRGKRIFFHIFCDFCVKQLTLCYGF
ncbi:hypothetical protein, partial [Treponema saccharophilum]|uniref:hypothetical protein n=1 Tax=Treponema saccharophilum TaxID=165 RepID=UPI001C26A4B0